MYCLTASHPEREMLCPKFLAASLRIGLGLAPIVMLSALTGAAVAQDYPSRPIKFMHGFPPGGNVDIIARLLGNEMGKALGQSIVIEAKPGVAGSLAAETVARSDPDGYTLLVLPSAHPAHGALAKNVKYKVVDDFEWISVASFYPFLICVRKDSPIQTFKQLIDEARKNPGALKYGSAGVGSILHTTVELIANETKTKYLHVPYRGEAPAITALLQGEIDFIAVTTGPISERIRSGEFRALAVTGKTRWRDFPELPTVEQQGIPGFEVISWTGLAGPAKLPKPILDKLNGELRRAIAVPDVKSKLENMGGDPRGTTPGEMRALVASQFSTWSKLAKEANISID
jgi:tripartite-type tricarboxylate transporter receptor subunit TctC